MSRPPPKVQGPDGRPMSVGQRWKVRRDYVICLTHLHGASQRLLADVFDLPHSRIAAIVKKFRQRQRQIGGAGGQAQ